VARSQNCRTFRGPFFLPSCTVGEARFPLFLSAPGTFLRRTSTFRSAPVVNTAFVAAIARPLNSGSLEVVDSEREAGCRAQKITLLGNRNSIRAEIRKSYYGRVQTCMNSCISESGVQRM